MTSLASGQLSRAVLIGVSSFTDPDLYDLPSVTNNVDTLHGMLTHPDWWGIPLENCARIKDDVSAQRVRELLREAARSAEDVLLVYYAGHGLPLDPDDLVLATTHTRQKSPRDSGVPIDDIRDVFLSSRARTRVLVLDCCYSGRALERLRLDKATATLASV
ncbi:caspase family protein, partial [Kibdelosporangium lantanae]